MRRKAQEGRAREQLDQWRSVDGVRILFSHLYFSFFFFILSCAPHTPGISETLFLSLFTEHFILLVAAKLAPSVIISWCFCAFTYVSQQGPVFGSDRFPCSLPPPCDVDPSKKISQEVFKLPFEVSFFFRASRFHYNTLAFAFRAVYIGSALFSFLGYPFIQTTPAICIISITLEVYTVLTKN